MRGTEWKFIERRRTARVQWMPCVGGLPGLKRCGLGQGGHSSTSSRCGDRRQRGGSSCAETSGTLAWAKGSTVEEAGRYYLESACAHFFTTVMQMIVVLCIPCGNEALPSSRCDSEQRQGSTGRRQGPPACQRRADQRRLSNRSGNEAARTGPAAPQIGCSQATASHESAVTDKFLGCA